MWMQYHSTATPGLGRNNDMHVSTTANTPHVSAWRIVCRSDDCCKPELCNCYKHITVTTDSYYSSIIWCVQFTISLLIAFLTFHYLEVYWFLLTKKKKTYTHSRDPVGGIGGLQVPLICWRLIDHIYWDLKWPILSLRKDVK